MKTTKQLALVSTLAFALVGCATPQRSPSQWEYRVVSGYTKPGFREAQLQATLKSAGDEGWEAVSWTRAGDSQPYFNVLLKRTKR